ncbi:MAG: YraN family protein [Gemmataceae bacterium]|nr:YraN family protein [Gemmataceae bacterium]
MLGLTHWPWWRRWFGSRSERAAAAFLRRAGYRIVVHNYRSPQGEIDLIATDGPCIVFVEVRSTAGVDIQRIAESIDREKQRRISAAARHFMHRFRLGDRPARFDVMLVQWRPEFKTPQVRHIKAAFETVEF